LISFTDPIAIVDGINVKKEAIRINRRN